MSLFVLSPNLPQCCSAVIYGEKYAGLLSKALEKLHIESILMPDNPDIGSQLTGHADLSILHAGGERLFLAPFLKGSPFVEKLSGIGLKLVFPELEQGKAYPYDAQFNLCIVGNRIICNRKTAAPFIVEYLTRRLGDAVYSCRQGYSRCAVCIVDERSVITADRGIAGAAEAGGLDVLRIRPGAIRLEGFAYGFLGGASFKIASDKLAFTGRLDDHPDRDSIFAFLHRRSIEPVYLTQEPIFDIGTAIPIKEN